MNREQRRKSKCGKRDMDVNVVSQAGRIGVCGSIPVQTYRDSICIPLTDTGETAEGRWARRLSYGSS